MLPHRLTALYCTRNTRKFYLKPFFLCFHYNGFQYRLNIENRMIVILHAPYRHNVKSYDNPEGESCCSIRLSISWITADCPK